ncbi:Cell division protein FtsX [hydrothermal vent metagenome]|uniref:Cell division protein FtsX n=1 Tax=hydrothermal vent metagenome TaxID=652676 RepID=A0A1W1BEA3_9ZZZZ
MQSIKNHLSLILALVSILFAMQTLIVTNRAMDAYEQSLKNSYSLVVVSDKKLSHKQIKRASDLIAKSEEISVDDAIKKIDSSISKKNMELLKVTLPHFYRILLVRYPSPSQIEQLKTSLARVDGVKKIEDFKATHDITFKLLMLFKTVVTIFSFVVFIVTSLLIAKELRIWQYKHNERMNIMGLFGAPKWLSSAVLFRLAIIDAFLSTIIIFIVFSYIANSHWLLGKLESIGIDIVVFDMLRDFPMLFGAAFGLAILLAVAVVFGHKEEV